jgi:hypothetical protein
MMSDKKPQGWQIPAINPSAPYVQESFDLARMDAFVKSLGANFYHWKATPSPIGLNDRGDYRRNDVDVITSNGYIYTFGGVFTATMTGNQKEQKRPGTTGAVIDSSTAYLVLPRFYNDSSDRSLGPSNGSGSNGDNEKCCGNMGQVGPIGEKCCDNYGKIQAKRIRLTPGDRLYHDPTIDDLVVNKELLSYSFDSANIPMFPIVKMDGPIVDSRGIYYKENIDFTLCNGNVIWTPGAANPGIDPDTGAGRTYSIRYLYRAFYYVTDILREVRITDVTEGNVRRPERAPMHVAIQREYIWHNINQGNELNKPPNKATEPRQVPEPINTIDLKQGMVRVETTDIDSDT